MRAVGQKRHGMIGKAADDLHAHEYGGNNRRPFRAGFRPGMTLAQEHVIAGPDAVIVWLFGIMVVVVLMIMPTMVVMAVIMMAVVMIMGVIVTAQGMVMCHRRSLARYQRKIS